ncbi:MAG: T9SS type A sorting domain-containing protein [Vicingaceae bacterium]|nr:T9SS type A sorting domain-containing protein [Vicingaceae bacterium]
MKKLNLFIIGIVVTTAAYAQPTLNSTNHAPSVGDNQLYYIADSNSVIDNTTGANVTFDYSNLEGFGMTQTSYYVNPTTTTYTSNFPNATYADTTLGSPINKRYGQLVNTDSLVNNGMVLNINTFGVTVIEFFDPEKTITYPFTFGNSFNDVYSGQFTAVATNTTTNGSGTVSVNADAWGTLLLPNSVSIPNVLRVVQFDSLVTDTIILPFPLPAILPLTIKGNIINYYEPSVSKYPLLSIIDADIAGNSSRTVISQYPMPLVGVNELENKFNLTVYPNPIANENATLKFELKSAEKVEITLLNQLGQELKNVFTGNMQPGMNTLTIETANLAKGIYFVSTLIGEQKITKKLIVQ